MKSCTPLRPNAGVAYIRDSCEVKATVITKRFLAGVDPLRMFLPDSQNPLTCDEFHDDVIRQRGKDAHMINLTMKPSMMSAACWNASGRGWCPVATVVCLGGDESNHTGYAMENGRYRCDGEPGTFVDPD